MTRQWTQFFERRRVRTERSSRHRQPHRRRRGNEDAPDKTIDLAHVFDDPDDDSIVKTAISSAPSLVIVTVVDDALTLNFQPNSFGTATVVVTGNARAQTVDDAFMVTVAPVDDPPVVANTISDVNASEDDLDFVLSLTNVFNDIDDDNASILKTEQANTNPGLVTATIEGDDLTLDFQANRFGTAIVTIRGTSNGKSVDDSFDVTVAAADDAPVVLNPIADLSSLNTGPNVTIDLSNVFDDVDDDNALHTSRARSPATFLSSPPRSRTTLLHSISYPTANGTDRHNRDGEPPTGKPRTRLSTLDRYSTLNAPPVISHFHPRLRRQRGRSRPDDRSFERIRRPGRRPDHKDRRIRKRIARRRHRDR